MRRIALCLLTMLGTAAHAQSSAPALPEPPPPESGPPVKSVTIPADPERLEWPDTKAGRLARKAVAAHDRGDFKKAIELWRKALELEPRDKMMHYELALSLTHSGDSEGAYETLMRAIVLPGADHPELYVMLGSLEDEKGRSERAIAHYRRGIAEFPDYFNLHFNLGVTYNAAGRPAEARAAFQRALALNPDHPGSHYGLGAAYANEAYFVPALMALGRFLELEPAGKRADQALRFVEKLLAEGVTPPAAAGERTSIANYSNLPADEGEQTNAFFLVRALTATMREKSGAQTPLPILLYGGLNAVGRPEEGEALESGFAGAYYLPYYRALNACGCWDGLVMDRFAGGGKGGDERARAAIAKYRAMRAAFQWNRDPPIAAASPAPAAETAPAPAPAP